MNLKAIASIMVTLAILAMVGCDQPPQVSQIDKIQIWTPQTPVKLSGHIGPAGVQALLFFYQGAAAQTVTVLGQGNLEMMVFDGKVPIELITEVKPLKTWTYTPQELLQYRTKTYGLWSYQLTLIWGEKKPTQPGVTILAKYLGNDGQVIYSTPVYMKIR